MSLAGRGGPRIVFSHFSFSQCHHGFDMQLVSPLKVSLSHTQNRIAVHVAIGLHNEWCMKINSVASILYERILYLQRTAPAILSSVM